MRYKKKGAGMPKGARNGMYMNGGKMYATGGAVPKKSFMGSAAVPGDTQRSTIHKFEEYDPEGMPGLYRSTSNPDVWSTEGNAPTSPEQYKAERERKRQAEAEKKYAEAGRKYKESGEVPLSRDPGRRSSLIGDPSQGANPRTGEGVSYGDAFERYAPEFLREFNKMQYAGINDVPVVTKDRTQTQTGGGYDPSPRSLGRVERDYRGTKRASQLPEGQRTPALLDFLNMFSEQQKTQGNKYVQDKKRQSAQRQAQGSSQGQKYKNGGRIR